MTIRCNKFSLFCLLLTGVTVVMFAFAAHAAIGSGNWSVNKVSAQNYCTVSQSFAGMGTVTLGQTTSDDYSMAFDFTNSVFTGTKPQSVSIKTDKVAVQNFSITPQSNKLAILNLGQNNQLWQSFHKGDALTVTVNGKNYDFKPAGTTKGRQDLSSCVASLKQPEKQPTSSPVQQQVAAQPQSSTSMSNQELAVREENTKLRQALQTSQAQLETLKSSGDSSAKQNELSEKLRVLEIENAQLKATGNAIQSGAPADLARAQAEIAVLAKQKEELERQLKQAPRTVVSAQELNNLSRENAELKSKLNDAGKNASQTVSLAQERDGLKAQLAQLQQQLIQAQTQKTAPTASDMKLADMQKENADLKARLATANNKIDPAQTEVTKISQERDGLKAQLAQANLQLTELQKKSIERANNKAQPNSKELQKRLAELQTENANLKLQMADAKQPMVTVNPAAKAELETLRAQIASLQSQNTQLQTQVATAPAGSVSTTPAAQNFDLAQANKRYEEAQREIRRLGSIIQAQEQKFQTEKRDIEGMLFDPAIAAPAQVAMKESYEKRISDLEGQLKSKGIAPTPSMMDPQAVARMVEPASGVATQGATPIARMPSGYGAPIPSITEAELARDMMPLPPSLSMGANIEVAPVERVIERIVEKSDPKKDAELARITQELEALKNNQNKMAQENEQLKTAMQQKQVARAIEDKVPDNGLELSPPVSTPPRAMVTANFATARDITNLLKQSGVSLTEAVSDMGGGSDTYKAFRWKADGLHGSIEQKVTGSASDYQAAIASYIDRARSRCKSDFAAEPANISSAIPNSQGYEIACIGGKVDSSASVFFTYSDRIMSTIAHEGKTELMGNAIAARDNIAQNFAGSVTALR